MTLRSISMLLGLTLGLLITGVVPAHGQDSVTKYLRFRHGKTNAYGVLEGDQVRQLSGNLFARRELTDKTFPLKDVKILTPVRRPSKVLALAGNYKDHLGDKPAPEFPEPFFKPTSCLIPHQANIVQPDSHAPVHYEAELVVVIGKRATNVTEAEALDYVFGITCGNDISARDWQANDVQWWRAKGTDTFGPCGPYIATGLNYDNLEMQLRVNGEVRQKTRTQNMIHSISQAVSFISQHMTLLPGDLIYTGTPGKTQPLHPGDEVEVEIEGVGVLKNHVVSADR